MDDIEIPRRMVKNRPKQPTSDDWPAQSKGFKEREIEKLSTVTKLVRC